uniref:Uncharacterized protein n=1 Tax=Panagrolaimus sp. JU765 TaxID=591449 RepID=A0AC34PYM9_9BILA
MDNNISIDGWEKLFYSANKKKLELVTINPDFIKNEAVLRDFVQSLPRKIVTFLKEPIYDEQKFLKCFKPVTSVNRVSDLPWKSTLVFENTGKIFKARFIGSEVFKLMVRCGFALSITTFSPIIYFVLNFVIHVENYIPLTFTYFTVAVIVGIILVLIECCCWGGDIFRRTDNQ